MADNVMVVSVPPYEGEYEFDLAAQPMTTLEWRWVKKISGYLPLTAAEGFAGADPDLFLSWAIIAMVRAGRIEKSDVMEAADVLADAPFDGTAITFKGETEAEEEESPLDEPSPEEEKPSSGDDSNENGEPSPASVSQLRSGLQVSATGSGFVPETSAT